MTYGNFFVNYNFVEKDNSYVSYGIEKNLKDLFYSKYDSDLKINKLNLNLNDLSYKKNIQNKKIELVNLYQDILNAKDELEYRKSSYEHYRLEFEKLKKSYELGASPKINVESIELEVEEAEIRINILEEKIKSLYEIAKNQYNVDFNQYSLGEFESLQENFEDLLKNYMQTDIEELENSLKVAKEKEKYSNYDRFMPDLYLGYERVDKNLRGDRYYRNQDTGFIKFSKKLFSTDSEYKTNKLEVEKIENELKEKTKKIKDEKLKLKAEYVELKKLASISVKDYSYMITEKSDNIGSLNLNGRITANNPIGIFVDKKLKVKEVFIKNGDFVQKNQVLMTFDDDEKNKLYRNIEKEQINLSKIRRDLNTTRELYKIGGASKDEIKNLEDSYRISELNIEELNEVLSKTVKEVRSPVDGVVSNLKAQANYLVDTDNSLLEIIDSSNLRIVIEIPEYNSEVVKVGQSIRVRQDISEDNKFYDGEIVKISKLSTASTLTSENVLEADVKTKEEIPNLTPGFKIKAVLDIKSDSMNIIIPKIALQNRDGQYYVYVLDKENIVREKKVEIKNVVGENILITSGLEVGENLIVTPDDKLKDGLKLVQ